MADRQNRNLEDKIKSEKQRKKILLIKNIVFGVLLTFGLISISIFSIQSIGNKACGEKSASDTAKDRESDFIRDLNQCDLNDPKLWTTLVVIMSAGAAGGLVFELLNLKGNIEWPHGPTKDELAAKFAYATPENLYDLGYLARLFIGAFSAPVTIAAVGSSSVFAMLATSVVAGSSGALIFRALQDRLTAAIYNKQLDEEQKAYKTQKQHFRTYAGTLYVAVLGLTYRISKKTN
ncbi:MAG TPA: hypothetical protein V6D11_12230 [Waterburya sp.]|jgi:hypothetical protein